MILQVGVGALVIAYTIVGAFIFQAIEADDTFAVRASRLPTPNAGLNQTYTSVEFLHSLSNLRYNNEIQLENVERMYDKHF